VVALLEQVGCTVVRGADRLTDDPGTVGVAAGTGDVLTVTPPSWRPDLTDPADLVEEVARIVGFDALPSTPLPQLGAPSRGVLNPAQARVRTARRAMAALGWAEAVTWSFLKRSTAELFGGGSGRLVVENPIAADLECMRPSALPNLLQAAARKGARGHADVALFEIGPIYMGDGPTDQRTVLAGVLSDRAARHWSGSVPSTKLTRTPKRTSTSCRT
jgi:phenylalanyl-tRNA synthetase beta chain